LPIPDVRFLGRDGKDKYLKLERQFYSGVILLKRCWMENLILKESIFG
jgi:hypothetical protein